MGSTALPIASSRAHYGIGTCGVCLGSGLGRHHAGFRSLRLGCRAGPGLPFPQNLFGRGGPRPAPAVPAQGGAAIKHEKRKKAESPEPREGGRFLRRRRPVRTSTVLPCRGGGQVGVEVEERGADIRVTIRLLGREAVGAGPAALLWGVCRGSMRRWHHPQGVAPAGSVLDETSGAMRSPFPHGKDAITLTFRAGLAPATLAFAAAVGHRPVLPLVAPHFAVPLGMLAGDPRVLGPSRGARGVNFAVASASARGMSLVLFSRHRPGDRRPAGRGGGPGIVEAEEDDGSSEWAVALELELDPSVHRTGAVWHVGLPALRPSADLAYAWRVDGEEAWDGGNRTQPGGEMLVGWSIALWNLSLCQ